MRAAASSSASGRSSSLAQSLHLLNSKELQEKIAADKGYAAFLASDSSDSDQRKIKNLYLTAYAREPNEKEIKIALGHIEGKSAGKAEKEQLAAEAKTAADRAAEAALAKVKVAEARKTAAANRSKAATERAQPRDVTITVYSAPISIQVKADEKK